MKYQPFILQIAISLTFTSGMLLSCSSPGVLGQTPESQVFQVASCEEGQSLIYIIREKRYAGSANMIDLVANGSYVYRMRNESYYPFCTAPGKKDFSGSIDNKSLFLTAKLESNLKGDIEFLEIEAEPNQTYYLELIVKGMNPRMIQLSEATGKHKLQSLRLYKEQAPGK